ncbi:TPR repeat-containing protein [Tanticharoenia sakaeratensis NBRC 103193]|nr:TPR repeat-containing protein [Tanticharoenia sakaeratensis NBRC 103193]
MPAALPRFARLIHRRVSRALGGATAGVALGAFIGCISGSALAAPFDSGDFLNATIAAHDGDIAGADRAFARTLAQTPDARFLLHDAFRFAAMDSGADAARRALALAPSQGRDELALIVLGDDAFIRGDIDRARSLFSASGDATHMTAGPIMRLISPILQAWCLQQKGDTAGALGLLEPLSKGKPFSAVYALHAALIAAQAAPKAAHQGAMSRDAANRASPTAAHVTALFELAQSQSHDTDLVLTRAQAAWLAAQGHAHEAHAALATLMAARPNLSPAKNWVLTIAPDAMRVSPREGIALAYLAVATGLQSSVGDHGHLTPNGQQVAIVLVRQGLALAPSMMLLRMPFAEILGSEDDLEGARETLAAVPATDPLSPVVAVEMASFEDRSGHLKAAIADLRQALRTDPDNADLHAALGDIAQRDGQLRLAVDEYDRALSEIPLMAQRRWSLLLARAACHDTAGHWDVARGDLEQAVALAPDEPILLNYLGYGEVEHNHDLPRATALLKHAVELAPDDPAIRDSFGWALLRTGHLDQALVLLQSAAERTPRDPEVNYHLGMAYWQLGRVVEARDQWNEALVDKPSAIDRHEIDAALAMPLPDKTTVKR